MRRLPRPARPLGVLGPAWAGAVLGPLTAALLAACGVSEHQVLQPVAESLPTPADGTEDASPPPSRDTGPPIQVLDAGSLLDPDAHFDWAETVPSLGGCREGSYEGNFTCPVATGVALTGEITFTLGGSGEEETLTVEEGRFFDPAGFVMGNLEGSLDCANDLFHAESVDGTICAEPPCAMPSTLEAAFDAPFIPQEARLEGTWTLVTDVVVCAGTWNVQATP